MSSSQIARRISELAGVPDIVQLLSSQISHSELSSLLLEVYQQRASGLYAGSLLQEYRKNRFVQPADTNMLTTTEKELEVLRLLQQQHYEPVELSPVSLFGSCAAVGTVSQHKIISAVRQTEVLADATNALALHIAAIRHQYPLDKQFRYSTIHRHVRAAHLPLKGYSPHFKIACMVAAGKDTGNLSFETQMLKEQLSTIHLILSQTFQIKEVYFKFFPRGGYKQVDFFDKQLELQQEALACEIISQKKIEDNNYYKGLQFKAYIKTANGDIEIADGGFTDWTQQLLNNRKERCLIAGIGLSLLYKLFMT